MFQELTRRYGCSSNFMDLTRRIATEVYEPTVYTLGADFGPFFCWAIYGD